MSISPPPIVATVPAPPPPLRLALYIPNFHGGGVERINLLLIDAFVAMGVDVTIVVHSRSGDLLAMLPPTVKLVSLDSRRSLGALPRLVHYLRRASPDVLMSSLGHNNIVALWARQWLRLSSRCTTRVVVCQHNALSNESRAIGTWQHRILPLLYRGFGRQADAIIGVSHGVSADMARTTGIDPARITTIHNPVLGPGFAAALAEPSSHRWLHEPGVRVIVGIGRLVPQKDFPTLLAAFARLGRAETRLLILGEGEERARLQQLAAELGVADRCELAGFALNPLPSLRDASVMVMSSIYEGFGNVLVEALAAGVPVVSTRCPYGPDEILDDGRFGELVPVGAVDELAGAIARQLDAPRPPKPERQARANDFHVDSVARRYLALLESLVHGRPPFAGVSPTLARGVFVYLPALHMGGAELSLVRLAEGFAQAGVPVTLVVHGSNAPKIEVPAGISVVSLGTHRSLFAVTHLRRLLRVRRPGYLLSAFPHSNVVAVLARWLSRIDCRVVISEHAPMTVQYARMGGWRYRLLPPFVRWAYPRADAIVAVSGGVADDMRSLHPSLTPAVIHNPVLPSDWSARADAPSGHPWLDAPQAGFDVVLTVSRLSVEKDIPVLIEAFAAIAPARPRARLLIAGEGPERSLLERLVAKLGLGERVQLTGAIDNPLAWMRRARVFALASQYEGFGNVLVEALAAGTQVISTDCPVGPREVLQGGRLGRLVPVGDRAALAQSLAAALDRGEGGEAPAAAALDVEGFTQQHSSAAYLALFESLAPRGAAALAA